MIKCKLLDKVMFDQGCELPPGAPASIDSQAIFGRLRTCAKKSVLLDARKWAPGWCSWIKKCAPLQNELLTATPPWEDVFVYFGDGYLGADYGIQVHQEKMNDPARQMLIEEGKRRGVDETYIAALINADVFIQMAVWVLKKGTAGAPVLFSFSGVLLTSTGRFISSQAMYSHFSLEGQEAGVLETFALYVFQLTHCRNIVTKEQGHYRPAMPRGRRNKAPKIRFHTLEISDSVVKSVNGSEVSESSSSMPKHVCRGSFAHYTEEKPLFGKYVGTFWRPMHIKGSAKHGIVGKEYSFADQEG